MRTLKVLVVAIASVAACAGARPKDAGKTPAPAASARPSANPSAAAQRPNPRASASGVPGRPGDTKPAATEPKNKHADAAEVSPSSCPAGMVLVDGDYCNDVEHVCKRSWFDKNNKKVVCEEFEPQSRCVGGTKKKRFCIDMYTWPNQKGARPEVMNRFHQAQMKCAAVGKRMCTESEWTMACEGPRELPFPYGYVRDTKKCHGDLEWDSPNMKKVAARDPEELARLWRGVRNGSQPECISEYGVADLPGNVDEVVASESFGQPGYKGKFDSVNTGGPWYKGVRNQCRPKIYTHDEGFYYYYLGFRCCAEPDGKPTEPLTPFQLKKGWTLERVERSADFTLGEIRQKLEQKAQGRCECKPNDILCKTMCGTLLGPGAKDAR